MRTAVCPLCQQRGLKWGTNALGMKFLADFHTGAEHYLTCSGLKPGAAREPLAGPEPGGQQTPGMRQGDPGGQGQSGQGQSSEPIPANGEPSGEPGQGQSGQSSEPIPSNGPTQPEPEPEPEPEPSSEPDPQIVREWVAYVQAVRARATELKQRFVVSPRASINGAVLLRHGEPWAEVVESVLWKGHAADQRAEIERAVPAPSYAAVSYAARSGRVKSSDHMGQSKLDRYVSYRRNIMLVGPAGGGKTTGTSLAAERAGLAYFEESMGPQTSKWDLVGYRSPDGLYVPGILREPYEHGGMLCLDEMDAANPAVLTVINSAIANGHCSFPDGRVTRHPDFVLVACANTFGRGADRLYVGRQQLDAATLDRFVVVEWEYDERAERVWAGVAK